MTAPAIETVPLYDELGALYLHELTRHGLQVAMLTHKWQRTDLLAPHSDLDVRVLLDRPPADWREWNHRLAAAHAGAVTHEVANRRLLEHPPGFAFTFSEAHRGRISPPELATWSLIHGHAPTVLNGVRWPQGDGASGPTPSNGQTAVHPDHGRPLLAGCACTRTTDGPTVEHLAEPKQPVAVGPKQPVGDTPTLQRWKFHAWSAPWSTLDERFYRGILGSRLGGRYQLAVDSTDNVTQDIPGYRRHCVAWHYLAPCWFAAAALATRTRFAGKSAALTQWHPVGLEQHAETFLRHALGAEPDIASRAPALRDLLRSAHVALDAAMRHVPSQTERSDFDETDGSQPTAWTMTAGMLRVRVARWLYYLDPPPGVATGYLITREAKELRAAAAVLRSLAADERTAEQRLAAGMAGLLPTVPTTPSVLRDALAAWERHHALVEDFLTLHST